MESKLHSNKSSLVVGLAIALIVVTGLIHFVETPDNLAEAVYKGVMFALNGATALVAAAGIYQGSKTWGWGLGVLVAGGAIVMYVVSRAIGLPGVDVDSDWLEPMGVLSLVVEGVFIALAGLVLLGKTNDHSEKQFPATA
ncbi:MAG: hypothetical protein R3E39_04005 [Anaerolineae bacterium]